MPITITPLPTFNGIGPGISVDLHSDAIGPFPTGTEYTLQIAPVGVESTVLVQHIPFTGNFQRVKAWDPTTGISQFPGAFVNEGDNVTVSVQLVEPTFVVVDSGSTTLPFSSTNGLSTFIQDWANRGDVTLNPTQAAQLDAIQTTTDTINTGLQIPITDSTGTNLHSIADLFTHTTLDQFVTGEVTSGETFDPVRTTVGAFWYSIVVQVTTIPDNLATLAPDATFYPVDLASLRIIRGTDVDFRAGCHISDQEFFNPLDQHALAFSPAMLFGIAPEFTLAVDWRLGCGGRVFLKVFP